MQRQRKELKPKIVNCNLCGRDTTNKSKICVHCTGGHNSAFESDHERQSREIAESLYGDVMTRDEEIERAILEELDID